MVQRLRVESYTVHIERADRVVCKHRLKFDTLRNYTMSRVKTRFQTLCLCEPATVHSESSLTTSDSALCTTRTRIVKTKGLCLQTTDRAHIMLHISSSQARREARPLRLPWPWLCLSYVKLKRNDVDYIISDLTRRKI